MIDPVVTPELLKRLETKRGGWTKESLCYLGIEWPPMTGWKKRVLGKPRRPLRDTGAMLYLPF